MDKSSKINLKSQMRFHKHAQPSPIGIYNPAKSGLLMHAKSSIRILKLTIDAKQYQITHATFDRHFKS